MDTRCLLVSIVFAIIAVVCAVCMIMYRVGSFFLSVFILSVCAAISFFVVGRNNGV